MKMYLKQHLFSWNDRFSIYGEDDEVLYTAEGEFFSLGTRIRIYDRYGYEVAQIQQELFTLLPRFLILRDGVEIGTVEKEFSFFRQQYVLPSLGWRAEGDCWNWDYDVMDDRGRVATLYRELFTFGDAYVIEVDQQEDAETVLCLALVIDAVISSSRN